MSLLDFTKNALTAAMARGVHQCIVIGSSASVPETLQVFAVNEITSDTLPSALKESNFDEQEPSLILWLGGKGYKTIEAMIDSLRFIASLPKGTGLLLNYSALSTLASKFSDAGGTVKSLIDPQAVKALLLGVGFHEIEDFPGDLRHLVTALV